MFRIKILALAIFLGLSIGTILSVLIAENYQFTVVEGHSMSADLKNRTCYGLMERTSDIKGDGTEWVGFRVFENGQPLQICHYCINTTYAGKYICYGVSPDARVDFVDKLQINGVVRYAVCLE